MNSPALQCGVCGRPVPPKAVACPYCGEEIPRHPLWIATRRFAPWAMAACIAAAAATRGAALPAGIAANFAAAGSTPLGKLLLAAALAAVFAPSGFTPSRSRDSLLAYAGKVLAGLGAAAWGLLLPHAPPAAWVPLLCALPAQAAIRMTRDIEPWRILPAALIPIAAMS